VLFLQLVIDPACTVVFEAEPLEAGAMRAPPRRADQRLFDRAVLARGLWQGAGLLALLLALLALVRHVAAADPQRDALVRAVGFVALVLSNLALIFSNRRWGRGALRGTPESGRPFRWIALGTLAVLALVVYLPAASRLFGVVTPSVPMLLLAVGSALASLLWFEAVKRGLRAPLKQPDRA
jgi:Ca2+-transporting ATPase